MNKFTLLLSAILTSILMMAQTPAGINYQTVVRNGDGDALPYTDIWLKVSILADAPDGTVVYSEVHPATTNGFGLVNLVIGQGTVLSRNFGEINWSTGLFYLETAINFDGSAGYQLMGVTQLLSVPFAKYADFSAGLKNMTTEERNALQDPPAGMTIYNTTTNCLNYWSGVNWFETCGACTPQPSNPTAGPEQVINTADTVAQLAGNIPAVGTGLWTKVSGSGGYFEDPNDPKTKFHGKPCTVYRLRWSISTSCSTKHSYVYITFNAIPTVAAAGDDLLFNDETTMVTLSGNTPIVGNGLWTVVNGSGGSFTDPANPATTFTGLPCQTYTLRWTIATACSQTYDEINITFDPIPNTAMAGDDVVVNTELTTITLAANTPEVGSGLWTVTGGEGGAFGSATDPNTTFTGLPCQTYSLTWTISTACYESNDEMVVVFDAIPTEAVAGEDVLVNTQQTTILLAANAPVVGSGLWTAISGDGGVFEDATNPATLFTALLCENYTLRWTISTPCYESFDEMNITFDQSPATVSAGVDYTICQNNFHSLNGQAGNFSSVLWTTSGTGNFSNNAILNPTYTPGAADIIAGSVILTITVQPISPCATASSDDLILTIQQFSTADAGIDATICENTTHTLNGAASRYSTVIWSTSGTGSFSNAAILSPVYTPSTSDKLAGSVTLTLIAQPLSPCALATIDQMMLSIQRLSTANAGLDATICENQTNTLNGSAQRYSSLLWTTSGTGSFSNNGILNPIYTPSTDDKLAGSLILTLTAQPISPCAVSASDTKVLSIQRLSTANAGADATICANQVHELSGSALRYSAVNWSTSGTGSFSNPGLLSPVYTPSVADQNAGSVVITLTAQPLAPCAVSATDAMTLIFLPLPLVNAGDDQIDIPGTTTTLQGNAPTAGGTGLWTIASGVGGTISQPTNPTSQFSGIGGETYLLQWAITAQNGCSNGDFVIISLLPDGSPCQGMPTVTDIDGNVYNTVKIGNQCWMQENLKTTKYRNNSSIEYPGSNNTAWVNNTTGAYAWYDNDIIWKNIYGALYNWNAVNNSAGLCPTGWHVPTISEWFALTTYVGSHPAYLCNSNTSYIAKALAAKTNWNTYAGTCIVGNNLNDNNATNFTALPGGNRNTNGFFYNMGFYGHWWSSTENSATNAWSLFLAVYYANVNIGSGSTKDLGFSVRCLRD
ncbi:MAG: fibrobacter succinogenes major paralogous domain-containing protein [Bacteroidales bacterium]|nr:fibrobacter succinogenes major paralogous domain-containing protein [Bacteroidales bacterium]